MGIKEDNTQLQDTQQKHMAVSLPSFEYIRTVWAGVLSIIDNVNAINTAIYNGVIEQLRKTEIRCVSAYYVPKKEIINTHYKLKSHENSCIN